jgi:hypothetical protein
MHQSLNEDDFISQYFQDGNHPEEFSGDDNRAHASRPTLSPEGQALVNALSGRIKGSCRDNCVISKEAQEHIGDAVTAVKDIGDGKIGAGIKFARDQHKEVKELLATRKAVISKIITTVVAVAVTGILGLLIYGIMHKVQGG